MRASAWSCKPASVSDRQANAQERDSVATQVRDAGWFHTGGHRCTILHHEKPYRPALSF